MAKYSLVSTDLSQFAHLLKSFSKSLQHQDKCIGFIFLDSLKSQKLLLRLWENYVKVKFVFRWKNKEWFPVFLCL